MHLAGLRFIRCLIKYIRHRINCKPKIKNLITTANMSLSKALEDFIRTLYVELGTQQAVAEYLGITQSYVQQILSGRTQTKNMKIEVLDKMFPKLKVEFGAGGIINSGTSVNAPQTIYNHAPGSPRVEDVRNVLHDLLSHIMTSEKVPDNIKVILYQLVSDFIKDHEQQ